MLSIGDAADYTGLSVKTLAVLTALSVGPATMKIGSQTVYRKHSLDEWRANLGGRADVQSAFDSVMTALSEVGKTFDHVI